MKKAPYTRYCLMLLCSAVAMYITMYFNTYATNHLYFSFTRLYMTLIGIGAMALIMFLFMQPMYQNKPKNIAIVAGSVLLMVLATLSARNQLAIEDTRWMKAMIPHHSIAILTSERADLQDPEVKKLAEEIIQTQRREIAEMKELLKKLETK